MPWAATPIVPPSPVASRTIRVSVCVAPLYLPPCCWPMRDTGSYQHTTPHPGASTICTACVSAMRHDQPATPRAHTTWVRMPYACTRSSLGAPLAASGSTQRHLANHASRCAQDTQELATFSRQQGTMIAGIRNVVRCVRHSAMMRLPAGAHPVRAA